MLSCTVTYSKRVRKSKEELFSFKFNFCFNPNHISKMTGTLRTLGSSPVIFTNLFHTKKKMAERCLAGIFRE